MKMEHAAMNELVEEIFKLVATYGDRLNPLQLSSAAFYAGADGMWSTGCTGTDAIRILCDLYDLFDAEEDEEDDVDQPEDFG